MKSLISFLILILWIMGVVVATGFWSTTFAIFVPIWALYLSVQKLMIVFMII